MTEYTFRGSCPERNMISAPSSNPRIVAITGSETVFSKAARRPVSLRFIQLTSHHQQAEAFFHGILTCKFTGDLAVIHDIDPVGQ